MNGAVRVPIEWSRRLAGASRSENADRHLGLVLAFTAGATNAGGFLPVEQYTSHMTGIVSSMADNTALGAFGPVLAAVGALVSFVLGAMCSAVMVNFSRRRRLHSAYSAPLILEGVLLLAFGVMGARLSHTVGLFVPLTVSLLCFIMGLQNALMTKLSRSEVRTTHVTGMVTDIGIELGKLVYWNRTEFAGAPRVVANRKRLRILASLVGAFFAGGLAGAFGFRYAGYLSTVPLAGLLGAVAAAPTFDDALAALQRRAALR